MNLTTATLSELRQRKAEIEGILLSGNAENVGSLTDERNMISNRIAEVSENEPEVETVEEDPIITMAMEEIGLFGTPLGAYTPNDVVHSAIRKAVLPYVYKLIDENETLKAVQQINEENFNAENAELIKQLEERDAEITALKTAKYEAELLAADRATKIDNAYNELQEAKETIEQLNEKLIAADTVKIPHRTNIDGPAEVVNEKKREIYAVEYLGTNGNRFKAKYADTDEYFENYTVYKDALFVEVTAEEATTFRNDYLTAHPIEVDTNSGGALETEGQVVVPSVPTPFQDDSESTTDGLAEGSLQVVGQVGREEFNELVQEVEYIKTKLIQNGINL